MIALRKQTESFRLKSSQEVSLQHADLTEFGGFTFTNSTVGYRLTSHVTSSDTYDQYVIIHNGNNAGITVDATDYTVVYVSSGSLTPSVSTNIGTNTTVVFAKNN
jgi:hypothetical protein